ncbi:MAG: hypothetical protein SGCHY_005453, partial [Lobulomycetales sp.]
MLELVLLRNAKDLYQDMWPKILDMDTLPEPEMTTLFLKNTLATEPKARSSFDELYKLMNGTSLAGNIEESTICQLTNLTELRLLLTKVGGKLPSCLSELPLRIFDISATQIEGELFSLCSLENLEYFATRSADVSGELSCIWKLPKLKVVDLDFCTDIKTTLDPEMCDRTSLQSIRLMNTDTSGVIPRCLGRLTSLTELILRNTAVTGEIYEELCDLVNLQILNLRDTSIGGTIGECIGGLSKLTFFSVRRTNLGGQISAASLCQMTDLEVFDVRETSISGRISECIGQLSYLQQFVVRASSFAGTFPPEICNCPLAAIDIAQTLIEGQIPECIGTMLSLKYLDVGFTRLSGPIPPTIGDAVNLEHLSFGERGWQPPGPAKFTGHFPNIDKLEKLLNLYASVPTLQGPLPDMNHLNLLSCTFHDTGMCKPKGWGRPIFGRCTFSEVASCRECEFLNSWQPQIFPSPHDCCQLGDDTITCDDQKVTKLLLPGRLSPSAGPLSTRFYQTLESLEELDLSNNQLSGKITHDVANLLYLEKLNISHNRLDGNIPEELGWLTKLEKADLQHNSFSGKVPQSFTFLKKLDSLYLNNNKLSGMLPPMSDSLEELQIGDNEGLIQSIDTPSVPAESVSTPNSESKPVNIVVLTVIIVAVALVAIIASALTAFLAIRHKKKKKKEEEEIAMSELNSSKFGSYMIDDSNPSMWDDEKKGSSRISSTSGTNTRKLEVIGRIAAGAFGTVWKARYNGVEVAAKRLIIDNENANKVKIAKMFLVEAETMSVIKHPRIVDLIDFEINSFSIIMELMPLGSLAMYIAKNPKTFSWESRRQIMSDICEGMAFLHSPVDLDGNHKKELFHQDLKTGNVLLSMQNGVLRGKISDFGLSFLKEVKSDEDSTKHNGGTKSYLAPELLERNARFTKKGDVFAVGVIMLELVLLRNAKDLYQD